MPAMPPVPSATASAAAASKAPITRARRAESDGPVGDRFLALVRRIAGQLPAAPRAGRKVR